MQNHHWLSSLVPIIKLTVKAIEDEKSNINDLNVFPVPDGDTGTNILNTLSGMLADVSSLPFNVHPDILLDTIASSALKHSRGNSGVILAAMIGGATQALKNTEELTVQLLAHMLTSADASGRHAIPKPTEGTMLTVVRVMAEEATRLHESGETSVSEAAKSILAAGVFATKETHRAMAVLVGKDQIDSGAYAVSIIARSLYQYSLDKVIGGIMDWAGIDLETPRAATGDDNLNWQPGTPLYCTEFLWHWHTSGKPTRHAIRKYLASVGDSVQFFSSTDFAKVHVHTDNPYRPIRYFAKYGELSEVHVHNMRIQTEDHQRSLAKGPPELIGIVAVAHGEGIKDKMREAGATVVDGGQTSNPTTGAIAEAIASVNAEHIIVLPSNRNIILAANSAVQLCDKPCSVIPTENIPQSFTALLEIENILLELSNQDSTTIDFGEIVAQVTDVALSPNLRVASVSIATNDYLSPTGVSVHRGDFIAVVDGAVVLATDKGQNHAILSATEYLARDTEPSDISSVSIYTGEDYTGSAEDLLDCLSGKDYMAYVKDADIFPGGQPVFFAIAEVQVSPS